MARQMQEEEERHIREQDERDMRVAQQLDEEERARHRGGGGGGLGGGRGLGGGGGGAGALHPGFGQAGMGDHMLDDEQMARLMEAAEEGGFDFEGGFDPQALANYLRENPQALAEYMRVMGANGDAMGRGGIGMGAGFQQGFAHAAAPNIAQRGLHAMNNPGGVPQRPAANLPPLEEFSLSADDDPLAGRTDEPDDFGPPPLLFDTGTIIESASVRLHRALLDGARKEEVETVLTQMLVGDVRIGGRRCALLHGQSYHTTDSMKRYMLHASAYMGLSI